MIKQLFRFRSDNEFRTRSEQRDTDTDNEAIMSIAAAIEAALNKAENERTGLNARLEDILSRAAIVGGNDIDDYLTRTEDRSTMLGNSDAEIKRAEERLKVLGQNIAHVKFLKTALQTRFPDLRLKA
jgi:predicted component of type VI protein secretion system